MNYKISYQGVLTRMWVTGFSGPIDLADGERSVKASSSMGDAAVFSESEINEAVRLTRRCFASAEVCEHNE